MSFPNLPAAQRRDFSIWSLVTNSFRLWTGLKNVLMGDFLFVSSRLRTLLMMFAHTMTGFCSVEEFLCCVTVSKDLSFL